jgi:hypothetical protein
VRTLDRTIAARSAAGTEAWTGNGWSAAGTSALTGVGAIAGAARTGVNDNGDKVGTARPLPIAGEPGMINAGAPEGRRGATTPTVWAEDDEARRSASAAAMDRFMARVYHRPSKDRRS